MSLFYTGSKFQVDDANGDPIVSATIDFFELDGITRKDTYTTQAKTTANANPVVTNASGYATVVLDGEYIVTAKDELGNTLYTDTVTSVDQLSQQWRSTKAATYASPTTFTVVGDVTSDYTVGRRVRLTDSSLLYGTITASAFTTLTTVTVATDGGAALSASLTMSALSINDASEVNSQVKRFPYLTGNANNSDLVYAVNNSLYVPTDGDVIIIERSSSTDIVEIQYWEVMESEAALPGSATAGVVDGNSAGELYILNNGSNYYRFMSNQSMVEGPNLIVSGDFGTNLWQEGTSFTAVADDDYVADFWQYKINGTMVHDASKATDAPTTSQAGTFTEHCLLVDCTTADAVIGTGDFCTLSHYIEGKFFRKIAQNKFFIAFWHKHTKIGTYCVGFKNSGSDRSFVIEYDQNTTDTWELAFATVDASPSAGTWNYDQGKGLEVVWTLAAGSDYQTTANAWQTGNYFATTNQVNACDDAANNFKIALCQVGPGSQKTDFEVLFPQEVMTQSHRYLRYINHDDELQDIAVGLVETTTLATFIYQYPISDRSVNLSSSAGDGYWVDDGTGSGIEECDTVGFGSAMFGNATLSAIMPSGVLTVGNAAKLRKKSGASPDPVFVIDGRF